MNNDKIKIPDDFRETVLLLTVFFLIWSKHTHSDSSVNTMDMIVHYVVFASLLFAAIVSIVRDETLFCWEKAVFVATLCWEGCLIATCPFMELPSAVEWVSIGWMAALFVMMCVVAFLFPSLEKKGKWSLPISANDATGLAFNNYIIMLVSLLAINSSIF